MVPVQTSKINPKITMVVVFDLLFLSLSDSLRDAQSVLRHVILTR